MRALLAVVLLLPVAARAGPFDRRALRMPDVLHDRRPAEPSVMLEPAHQPAAAAQPITMNIGPFEAELGGQGKDRHFAHYQLQGTRILGGSLGGSFSGHSAKLELVWKSH